MASDGRAGALKNGARQNDMPIYYNHTFAISTTGRTIGLQPWNPRDALLVTRLTVSMTVYNTALPTSIVTCTAGCEHPDTSSSHRNSLAVITPYAKTPV